MQTEEKNSIRLLLKCEPVPMAQMAYVHRVSVNQCGID